MSDTLDSCTKCLLINRTLAERDDEYKRISGVVQLYGRRLRLLEDILIARGVRIKSDILAIYSSHSTDNELHDLHLACTDAQAVG